MRLLLVLLVALFPSVVRADPPETVWVAIDACPEVPLDAPSLLGLLQVELSADGIHDVRLAPALDSVEASDLEDSLAAAMALVRITASCEFEGPYTVRIDDLLTQKSVERRVALGDLEQAVMLRALALAVSELLHASWAELELREAPADPSRLEAALRTRMGDLRRAVSPEPGARALVAGFRPTPAEAPEEATVAPSLVLSFLVRAFPSGSFAPLGGSVRLDVPLDAVWEIEVDVEALRGEGLNPLGTVQMVLAGGGLALAARVGEGPFSLRLGARLGADVGWAEGRPSMADVIASSTWGFTLLAGVRAELAARLDATWSLRFGIEGSGVLVGFVARAVDVPVIGATDGGLAAWGGLAANL